MDNDDRKKEPSEHVGVLLDHSEAHGGQPVIFERDGQINAGVLKPLEEGKPIDEEGELVEVKTNGRLAIMKSHGRVGRATSQGPAMVNDKSYKDGWDRIFGKKQDKKPSKDLN